MSTDFKAFNGRKEVRARPRPGRVICTAAILAFLSVLTLSWLVLSLLALPFLALCFLGLSWFGLSLFFLFFSLLSHDAVLLCLAVGIDCVFKVSKKV